ncbi:MAG: WD40/YVTN/BNR-like repeat-containing protein [Chitinispirillaceae bacterium]
MCRNYHIPKAGILLFSVFMSLVYSQSQDSWSWQGISSGTDSYLSSVTWGKQMFVAVGGDGTILSSADGEEWTEQNSGTESPLNDVIWGKDQFMAVGRYGTVLTSPDGIEWNKRPTWILNPSGDEPDFKIALYGNGRYIVIGNGVIVYSRDGIEWQKIPDSQEVTNSTLKDVVYGGEKFVGIGRGSFSFTSENGIEWSMGTEIPPVIQETTPGGPATLPEMLVFNSIAYGNGIYLATGYHPSLVVSQDGESWSIADSTESHYERSIIFDGEQFILTGGGSFITTDGTDLQKVCDEGEGNGIAYNGEYFVAVGGSGEISILRKPSTTVNYKHSGKLQNTISTDRKNRMLRVSLSSEYEKREDRCRVFTIQGRQIADLGKKSLSQSIDIPLTNLASGRYILKVGRRGFPVTIGR